jgi:hypothetical protein
VKESGVADQPDADGTIAPAILGYYAAGFERERLFQGRG